MKIICCDTNPVKLIFLIGTLFFLAGSVRATVVHVPSEYQTIQAGIDACAPGDTVLVADGVYSGPGNRDLSLFARDIVLRSEHGPDITVIDCQGSDIAYHRAFYLFSRESNACVIDGFTVRNGYQDFKGGAVLLEDSSPTFRNCIFENNYANHGAAFYITFDAFPVVENCRFIGNTARDVGIIHSRFGANGTFVGCHFEGNTAANGIFLCYNASPIVVSGSFIDNHTDSTGGAVFLQDNSSPIFSSCLFQGNSTTGRGGAVFVQERGIISKTCEPVFDSCVFVSNSAAYGSGIYMDGPVEARVLSSVFCDNRAGEDGVIYINKAGELPMTLWRSAVFANSHSITCDTDSPPPNIRCSNLFGNGSGDWIGCIEMLAGQYGNSSTNPGWQGDASAAKDLQKFLPQYPDDPACEQP